MAPKSLTAFLLSSLLYSTTHAFVQLKVHPPIDNNNLPPQPSELDTARWVPIATLAPLTSPLPTPTPTPAPSSDEYNILPYLDPFSPPDLKKRQGAPAAAPAAQPTEAAQIPPATTYQINSLAAAGQWTQVQIVYTQTFVAVPDQWSSAGAGTIGLGTITGTVGKVRSRRSEPTEAPEVKMPQKWSA